MNQAKWIGAALLMALSLQGCGKDESASRPVTLDARLTEIYGHSCKTCHETPETGAPQTHNLEQWKPRVAQGESTLVDHIVNGYRAMPPLGQCIECTEDDLKTLMRFMSSPAADNEKKN
jgi:cytochrome c5